MCIGRLADGRRGGRGSALATVREFIRQIGKGLSEVGFIPPWFQIRKKSDIEQSGKGTDYRLDHIFSHSDIFLSISSSDTSLSTTFPPSIG